MASNAGFPASHLKRRLELAATTCNKCVEMGSAPTMPAAQQLHSAVMSIDDVISSSHKAVPDADFIRLSMETIFPLLRSSAAALIDSSRVLYSFGTMQMWTARLSVSRDSASQVRQVNSMLQSSRSPRVIVEGSITAFEPPWHSCLMLTTDVALDAADESPDCVPSWFELDSSQCVQITNTEYQVARAVLEWSAITKRSLPSLPSIRIVRRFNPDVAYVDVPACLGSWRGASAADTRAVWLHMTNTKSPFFELSNSLQSDQQIGLGLLLPET